LSVFFTLVFVPCLDGVSWVQTPNIKDVLVPWRKSMKKGWVFEILEDD